MDFDYDKMKKSILSEMNDPTQRIEKLEAFMCAVAKSVKCLPSFADPSPNGGNAHIILKIKQLTAGEDANNEVQ
jgi:hypothetical protein